MQPYFMPYTGYFRLFAATDLFVIYDCVQFPRRGWVHRNHLLEAGKQRWLTLPLARASREVLIRDLRFAEDADDRFNKHLRSFPLIHAALEDDTELKDALLDLSGSPVDYIERLLRVVVSCLGLPWHVIRSSTIAVHSALRGQERVIEITRRLGARRYVNVPGGRELYDAEAFAREQIELCFLAAYEGSKTSVLSRILQEDAGALTREIVRHHDSNLLLSTRSILSLQAVVELGRQPSVRPFPAIA